MQCSGAPIERGANLSEPGFEVCTYETAAGAGAVFGAVAIFPKMIAYLAWRKFPLDDQGVTAGEEPPASSAIQEEITVKE